MWIPPNHQCSMVFSITNHPFGGATTYGNPYDILHDSGKRPGRWDVWRTPPEGLPGAWYMVLLHNRYEHTHTNYIYTRIWKCTHTIMYIYIYHCMYIYNYIYNYIYLDHPSIYGQKYENIWVIYPFSWVLGYLYQVEESSRDCGVGWSLGRHNFCAGQGS